MPQYHKGNEITSGYDDNVIKAEKFFHKHRKLTVVVKDTGAELVIALKDITIKPLPINK